MRTAGKWSAGSALVVALLALLASLQLFHLTAEGSSKRTLRHSIASLTEIGLLLDRNFDGIQHSAQNAAADEAIEVPGFPIAVALSRADIIGASKAQVRELLLTRSADLMYSRGRGALRAHDGNGGDAGRFSTAGLSGHALGFLRSRNHDILGVTTFALATVCAALAIALVSACRGFGRLTSVGVAVVAAAAPIMALGAGARVVLRIAADGDREYVQREFLEIGQSLAWIPMRDGAAFTVLGLLFVLAGLVCAAWADRRGASGVYAAR